MRYQSKYHTAWADQYTPLANTGDWRAQRPVTNTQKCCQCGWCYLFCPTGSISDKGTHFEANLDYCKGCGICARVCLVQAIVMVREEKG
jgi:2-oxoacid:acceptor oxidoreductase delta subunit (pyruvate/2-ketoisovalerate family)